jgi:hypothetical protein
MTLSDSLKLIPSWVQVMFTVGGLVFGGGILYADVQDIKKGQERTEVVLSQYSQTVGQVGVLETRIALADKTNERIMAALEKLSGAVEVLGVSVARIDERTRPKDKVAGR